MEIDDDQIYFLIDDDVMELLISACKIQIVLDLLPSYDLLFDGWREFFLAVAEEFIAERMQEDELAAVLLVEGDYIAAFFQIGEEVTVNFRLISVWFVVSFEEVMACLLHFIVGEGDDLSHPALSLFLLTLVIELLNFFLLRLVEGDYLFCGCLDHSSEIEIFPKINGIVYLLITLYVAF